MITESQRKTLDNDIAILDNSYILILNVAVILLWWYIYFKAQHPLLRFFLTVNKYPLYEPPGSCIIRRLFRGTIVLHWSDIG